MLSLLKIRNLALVEDLVWEPLSGRGSGQGSGQGGGLIGVTGETGAGKSVIVGALKLIIGERADRGLVRTGCESCSVEAVFDLADPREVNRVLERSGLEPCDRSDGPAGPAHPAQPAQLIVRREISSGPGGGRNRQFVNCSPVTLGVLKQLGGQLVDLHGPHDHQSLLSRERQLDMLDAHAGSGKLLRAHAEAYRNWRRLSAEHEALATSERATEQEIDLLRHQIAEIEAAELRPEEAEELEHRFRLVSNGSQLTASAGSLLAALRSESADGGGPGILEQLAESARVVRELERLDPSAAEFTGAFDCAQLELEELAGNLGAYLDGLETDPRELTELEARLDLLQSLKRKYGNTIPEILDFLGRAHEKLAQTEGRGDELDRLAAEIAAAREQLDECASRLSRARRRGAPRLAREITAHLADLGLGHAEFSISLAPLDAPSADGAEQVEFLFSPNPGEPQKPLRAIASSGEISRVMLAAKSALAEQDNIPLLVFDEIDANVGGEIARSVGAKMASLAEDHQIIAITHLPQVASLAGCHHVVHKEFCDDGRTRSMLRELRGAERIDEVARMLGGSARSARQHARNLIAVAGPAPKQEACA